MYLIYVLGHRLKKITTSVNPEVAVSLTGGEMLLLGGLGLLKMLSKQHIHKISIADTSGRSAYHV